MGFQNQPAVLMVTRERGGDRRYGLGKSLAPVIRELSERGLQVAYLCQDDLPDRCWRRRSLWASFFTGVPALQRRPHLQMLVFAWLERLDIGRHAAAIAKSGAYSHVHVHDPWIGLGFWLEAKWRRLSGVRWGVTEHGFGSYGRATQADGLVQGPLLDAFLSRVERWVLGVADWVIAPTQLAMDQLARDLQIFNRPPHWHVIPHARPEFEPLERTKARRILGWEEQARYIVAVGRLVPLKRFDKLLEVVLELAPKYPDMRLCLLGEGVEEAVYRKMAQDAHFSGRLIIEATDDVGVYLSASDVYVSLSETESFGLANLEAICAGLPSVCTAVGGVPEVLGEGACLIDLELQTAFGAIDGLLGSAALRRLWSLRARQWGAAWPCVRTIGDSYVAVYKP